MIAFLRGNLHSISGDSVVIDVQGVGYRAQVPLSAIASLPPAGSEVVLFTCLLAREDGVSLYGFNSHEALETFRLLLNVSGVGPRGALSLLSVADPRSLAAAVRDENINLLTRAPGIGKKSAQRIVLELKDKLKAEWEPLVSERLPVQEGSVRDAHEALVALGYSSVQASAAIRMAVAELGRETPASALIKSGLKHLSGI